MAEAGLRDGHGKVEAGVELVAPVSEESALANAVWPAEEHEAAQCSALCEVLVGLSDLRMIVLEIVQSVCDLPVMVKSNALMVQRKQSSPLIGRTVGTM